MAKLPTEQDIGDLPASLPRRQGVGSWQPGDLARGATDIARGGQALGQDLGMYAGHEQQMQNETDTAAASSAAAVSHIQTSQAITNSNDPAQVVSMRENYQQNAADAASLIRDPNARQKFLLTQAPEVARYQVGADEHATGLVKNQAVADFGTTSTSLINAAANTDDEGQQAAAIAAIAQKGQSLVARGILTPEEWAAKARDTAHDYATTRVESEIMRAKQTGDTSRLQDLSKLFTFNPGEWGVNAPAGGAPASPGSLNWSADSGNAQAPGPQLAEKSNYLMNVAVNSLGATPNAAAAMIGHAIAESSLRTNVANDQGESSHGMFQWNQDAGRWQPFLNWAKSNGMNATDPAAQMQYAKVESQGIQMKDGTGRSVWDAMNQAKTSSEANQIWLKNFEQPRDQSQGVHDWRQKNVDFVSAAYNGGGGVPAAAPGAPQATPPRAIGDSLARGVGGVTGVMNAATGANPQQVLSMLRGQDVTTTHKDANGNPVSETAPGLKDADLKGQIVLSTGASNDANNASLVGAQLAVLKQRGVDLSNVTVLGVGNRADFQKVGVNATLQKFATQYGAKFQPLDAGMIGPDGVHPISAGYNAIAQQIGGAAPAGNPTQPSPFVGVPPAGAAGPNPHLAPPQSQWPDGARGVEQQPDGSFSYVMSEGNKVPVPGSRASGASGAPAPGNTGTLLDALKPQERAELGVRLQNEIDAIDRGKQAQDKQAATAAVSDLKNRVESMTSGFPIGPNEAKSLLPYANSSNPDVRNAYAQTMSIRDTLARYQNQSPAAVQADVVAQQAHYNAVREKYPNDPTIETLGLILNASQKYAQTYASEAAKQPMERAAKSGFLPNGIAPIIANDPNVEAAWARRVADAHTAADSLGVPVRYLQQSERPMMKQLAQQGGEPMVDMAMHIVKAAGPDAPAIFKEIGVDAPMFQKIGELAAGGGDPEAVRDIASIINAKNDKAARGDLPTFSDKMLTQWAHDPLTSAASGFSPDFVGRTRSAANMLMSAQASRSGWDPKIDHTNYNDDFVNNAYHLATGGTIDPDGTKYGGIVDRNAHNWRGASNPVMVPNTIKTDDFHSVVNSVTDADLKALPSQPVGKNGAPITAAQIQAGRLDAMPDKDGIFRGKYAVFTDGVRDDNHLVRDASGKPWTLDLGQPQLDAALRGRNPNSFLTKAPAAAPAITPDRYKATPGMIATGGEGLTSAAETN